jgi:hypothetical protein
MPLGYCPASCGIIGRGLEGTKVFRNQADRKDFLERVAGLCAGETWVIYAWALMASPAQAHTRQLKGACLSFRNFLGSRLWITNVFLSSIYHSKTSPLVISSVLATAVGKFM